MATLLNLGPHRHEVTLGEHGHQIELIERSGHTARFICDALMDSAALLPDGARLHFSGRGQAREVLDTSRAASARKGGAGATDGKLRASMNGRVVALQVHLGQRVSVGQPVLTLEAMKMEHVHVATVAGTVRAHLGWRPGARRPRAGRDRRRNHHREEAAQRQQLAEPGAWAAEEVEAKRVGREPTSARI